LLDISENGASRDGDRELHRHRAYLMLIPSQFNWDDPNDGLASTFAVGAIRNAGGHGLAST